MWLDIIAFQSTVNPKGKRLESEGFKFNPKFSTARLTRSYLLFETTTTGMPASRKSCNHWRISGVPSGLFQAIKVLSKSTNTTFIPCFSSFRRSHHKPFPRQNPACNFLNSLSSPKFLSDNYTIFLRKCESIAENTRINRVPSGGNVMVVVN